MQPRPTVWLDRRVDLEDAPAADQPQHDRLRPGARVRRRWLAPDATLRVLGHDEPSPDARELFRRCGPIWLTFAAAHLVADRRERPEDWWALAWLRGPRSPPTSSGRARRAFSRPGARAGLWLAGAANLAMAAGLRLAHARRAGADGLLRYW